MKNITDDSILRLIKVTADKLVIPNQDGGTIRECGNPYQIGDDIILMYTMSFPNGQEWVYYSYCNKDNLSNWTHKGKLNINRQMEDPDLLDVAGRIILRAEDKTNESTHVVCQFGSANWDYKTNTGNKFP